MFGKGLSVQKLHNLGVVQWIIGINAAVWLMLLVTGILFGAYDPFRLFLTLDLTAIHEKRWWEFFTYMWVHADPLATPTMGLLHILFNMSALWMFGRLIEMEMGKLQFISLYLISGLVAAGTFFLEAYFKGKLTVPYVYDHPEGIVGASGAVMGIVAAFSILRPNAKLYVFLIPYPVKAKWAMLGFVLVSLLMVFIPILGFIGHSAHIGGAIVGYLWIWIWLKTAPKQPENSAVLFVDSTSGNPVMEYISIQEIRAVANKASDLGTESLTPRERNILAYFFEKRS